VGQVANLRRIVNPPARCGSEPAGAAIDVAIDSPYHQVRNNRSGKDNLPASTLTSKGQITIPQEIREELHLRKGQRLEFRVDTKGRLIIEPLTQDVRKLKGLVRSARRRPPSLGEIAKAIESGYAKS
jgi:antitoxin PrlF